MSIEQRAGELYFVETYDRTMMGTVVPGRRHRATDRRRAQALAERIAQQAAGAIVYRQDGVFGEPTFVSTAGNVPPAVIAAAGG